MNIALWVVQGMLAAAFIGVGSMKLFAYDKYKAMTEKSGPSGLTRGLVTFIGVCEIAGALGVVLPMALGFVPALSVWAAAGLGTIMLLAVGYHLRRHEPPMAPGALLLMAAFVVVGRLWFVG
jgi:uncharacterized membrane protein